MSMRFSKAAASGQIFIVEFWAFRRLSFLYHEALTEMHGQA
jgi:hypothetical protein